MTQSWNHADRKTPRCPFPICCQKNIDPYLAKKPLRLSKILFYFTELSKGRKYKHTVHMGRVQRVPQTAAGLAVQVIP